MLFVVLCPGTPEGSTGSGSGFKASQKTGQRLKVSSDRQGEAGNQSSLYLTHEPSSNFRGVGWYFSFFPNFNTILCKQ